MMLGRQFGKLAVVRAAPARGKYKLVRCRCACGGEIVVRERHLEEGMVTSCGCGGLRQQNLAGLRVGDLKVIGQATPIDGVAAVLCECRCGRRLPVKRGELLLGAAELCGCSPARAPQPYPEEVRIWRGMLVRCGMRGESGHANYAGRGITVCRRWAQSFDAFIADMGRRESPQLTIERVDNSGHYSCGKCPQCLENSWPANCVWATRKAQAANRRPPARRGAPASGPKTTS